MAGLTAGAGARWVRRAAVGEDAIATGANIVVVGAGAAGVLDRAIGLHAHIVGRLHRASVETDITDLPCTGTGPLGVGIAAYVRHAVRAAVAHRAGLSRSAVALARRLRTGLQAAGAGVAVASKVGAADTMRIVGATRRRGAGAVGTDLIHIETDATWVGVRAQRRMAGARRWTSGIVVACMGVGAAAGQPGRAAACGVRGRAGRLCADVALRIADIGRAKDIRVDPGLARATHFGAPTLDATLVGVGAVTVEIER